MEPPLTETLDTYVMRQAATVGRRPAVVTRPVWVPHLPGEAGRYLGSLEVAKKVWGLVILQNGRDLVSTFDTVDKWNIETGRRMWSATVNDRRSHGVAACARTRQLAVSSYDRTIRILDETSGDLISTLRGHSDDINSVHWSSNGDRIASIAADSSVKLWNVRDGNCAWSRAISTSNVHDIRWSSDDRFLAIAPSRGTIYILDSSTGAIEKSWSTSHDIDSIDWSSDNRTLASGAETGIIQLWDAVTGLEMHRLHCNAAYPRVRFAPFGDLLAVAESNNIIIWNARTASEVERLTLPDDLAGLTKVHWDPQGSFIAAFGYDLQRVFFWDTRHLLASSAVSVAAPTVTNRPLPASLRQVPSALAQLHRVGIHPPLSLVRNLLDLIGGRLTDGPLAELAHDPATGIPGLIALRWPVPARVGLVALLLHDLPLPGWAPPAGVSPPQLRDALAAALHGEAIEPEAPPLPLVLLRQAAHRIDERLLSLLAMLGPDAVAKDPGLPLRLLPHVPDLLPFSRTQRRLLGLRVRTDSDAGQATAASAAFSRANAGGVQLGAIHADWGALLPSQLALPPDILAYRHLRAELLFRARQLTEPPRLRPTVLLLDVSPPTFGPVERLTRLAAFVVARSLLHAGLPVVLVTTGGTEVVRPIEGPGDLVEVWTQRSLGAADAARGLRLAAAVRANLRGSGGLEPVILLLTQPWFGAEEHVAPTAALRGLFVQYPGRQVRPALTANCERWQSLAPGQTTGLDLVLGTLLG